MERRRGTLKEGNRGKKIQNEEGMRERVFVGGKRARGWLVHLSRKTENCLLFFCFLLHFTIFFSCFKNKNKRQNIPPNLTKFTPRKKSLNYFYLGALTQRGSLVAVTCH